MSFHGFYRGKRVLLTGHTGFKGSWMVSWLLELGAEVHGIALSPDQDPALFHQLELAPRLASHHLQDIRDAQKTIKLILEIQPEVVIHMAAQPLVRMSYQTPVETFHTNVMGTIHVLEALREMSPSQHPVVAVMVTSDKCYENREWYHAYRESDPMGGHDPYSASKGACEIAIASYRRSFFLEGNIAIASARAGNVLGAGDWAVDRIVPDAVRAWTQGESLSIRHPTATRPWEHLLDPLSGYLSLAVGLSKAQESADDQLLEALGSGLNFGPAPASNRSVASLIEGLAKHWTDDGPWEDVSQSEDPHEAGLLNLAIDKARHTLGWEPVWDFETTVQRVAEGYAAIVQNSSRAREVVTNDLAAYKRDALNAGVPWVGADPQ